MVLKNILYKCMSYTSVLLNPSLYLDYISRCSYSKKIVFIIALLTNIPALVT